MTGPQKLPTGDGEMKPTPSEDAQLTRDQEAGQERRREADKPADTKDSRGKQGWH